MEKEILLPDLGADAPKEATVCAALVEAGDRVSEGDSIIEMATDKATFDVPSPAAGRIKKICVKEDDVVKVGGLLAIIDTEA